jgi:hypothetical protein
MVRLHRVGVLRTASVLALLYGLAALIFFAIIAVFVLLAGMEASGIPGMENFNIGAGVVGILIVGAILAVVYGLLGWVFTAIFCLLYNWVAGLTGGVEFELRTAPVAPAPAAAPPAPAAPSPPPAAPPPSS